MQCAPRLSGSAASRILSRKVCNPGSEAWQQSKDHLQRNSKPLQVGSRRFWNLNAPLVQDYLDEKQ
ncbi:hypothetical protein QEH59_09680 [Coraliomargarita sp. SDUM461004]|uniref:Uncharacterized protein n=1 Tax=Thalassobacterium sedimentorum TaxID=3041258 RepID=A0ABU1AIQ7_9BACT|nr:hypothetical protein [Coraliomargarita sp. SDUM461004]MDQ8194696.1 hypothetical protein [Coraliomargarita sp. SDUM461004]